MRSALLLFLQSRRRWVVLLPAPTVLHSSGFGNTTSARKVAVKSLEFQVLPGSPSEGCFYFIFSFPRCKQRRGSERKGFHGLCLQRSYNTLCFLRHDTAWQNKVFILCTCQLRSASSQMMKYYRICCCLFPLGTCADLFKVSSAPSKRFIYYSWHLKNIWGKYIKASHRYYFCYLLSCTYVLTRMKFPSGWLCFLRVPPVCVCVFWAAAMGFLEMRSSSVTKMHFDSWRGQLNC